jgi:hypothetical protein
VAVASRQLCFYFLALLLAPLARGTEEAPLPDIIDSAVTLSGYARPEREAYRLENRYIMEVQHGFALMVIPPYDCPGPAKLPGTGSAQK